jgi:hypothetical protein
MTSDEPTNTASIQHQHQQYQSHHLLETFIAQQRVHGAAMEDPEHPQYSPAATVLGSLSSRIEHPQPLRPPGAPTTSAQDVDHNIATNKIRLSLLWDMTPVNVWLDLGAPGEAFFKSFQQMVKKRKPLSERAMMTIYLKKDKHTPDDKAYALSLDEDDLDADWETTVTWLEENKRVKSPHIYGWVEVENEEG